MSYIGNVNGPTVEGILAAIPPENISCSPTQVDEDIFFEELGTQHGAVTSVQLDEDGHPFLELCNLKGERFRVPINSPHLSGDISVEVKKGDGVRQIGIAQQVALHQWRLKITPPPAPHEEL